MATDHDELCMRRALELAALGEGAVEPNPMVGCVIAREGRIVGEGFHQQFGGPHAEINALAAAGPAAHGATLYVTLEPCCHHGKTPPCTQAILQAGIARVVAAQRDPFPQVAGGGLAELLAAGVPVDVGIGEREARRLNAPYLKLLQTGRPWTLAKWAMSLDGKIATRTGESRWISGEASRAVVHGLRGRVDAIVVGSGTARRDDPLLTARPPGPRQALRVVVDGGATLAADCQLVRTAGEMPVLIAVGPAAPPENVARLQQAGCEVFTSPSPDPAERLENLWAEMGRRRLTNVLVEGGSHLLGALFDAGLVDEVHAFIAPRIIGGAAAPAPVAGRGKESLATALRLAEVTHTPLGNDCYLRGRVERAEEIALELPSAGPCDDAPSP